MDKDIADIAKLFKDRENPDLFDITTAKVIQENPLVMKVYDKFFLSKEYNNIIFSASLLKDYTVDFEVENISGTTTNGSIISLSGTFKNKNNPKIGEEFIAIPMNNGSLWYIIDKAVRL